MDAGIRFCMGRWPGLEALPLCPARPPWSPRRGCSSASVLQVEELARHTLIHLRETTVDLDNAAANLGPQENPSGGRSHPGHLPARALDGQPAQERLTFTMAPVGLNMRLRLRSQP